MTKISDEKKKEVYELVEKQKIAHISWVTTVTQLNENDVKEIAWDLGLVIKGNQVLLPSETIEGKKEIQIQKNYRKILEIAINERVLRNYNVGKHNSGAFNKLLDTDSTTDFFFDLAILGIATTVYTLRGSPSEITPSRNVETVICYLNGTIDFSVAKADKMIRAKEILYKEIIKQYKQEYQCLVPIKNYYDLIVIPKNDHLLINENQTKAVLALSEFVDNKIKDLCDKIVEKSTYATKEKGRKTTYKLLMASGKKVDCIKKHLHLNKYSLYLYYRTILNKIFHDNLKSAKIPCLLEFLNPDNLNVFHYFNKHINYLFDEFINLFDTSDTKETANIIKSILDKTLD